MKLYHFCAAKHLDSILESGLSLGRTPIQIPDSDPEYFRLIGYVVDTQWLTLDPDWEKQSWCTKFDLSYRRNAFRLTIKLPAWDRRLVLTAPQLCNIKKLDHRLYRDWAGSSDWRVFMGVLPRRRIVAVDKNPVKVEGEPITKWELEGVSV